MGRLVIDYLEDTRAKYPDKTAFIDDKRQITFSGLYDEASHVASGLVSRGIFKQPVLMFMEKSVSLVSSFIGAALSGNFYSPVDTKMPEERINKIITTLKPALVITDKAHEEQVRGFISDIEVCVFEDLIDAPSDIQAVNEVRKHIIDTDILYVLFTSGSTGDPKGVIINHRAVVDFTDWISECYGFDETTVFGNQAQLYFDLSIQDVYAPLKTGATTVLISNRLYRAPVRVWKTILQYQINTLVWIPSMISLFANLDILANVDKAPIRTVLFCGEVMPVKQLNYWIANYPDTTYANLYGPTECTEACTYYTIDRKFDETEVLPIGKPCENCEVILLSDDNKVITEKDVIGELCVRGTCLSDGYYGNPVHTQAAFVQNPANDRYRELIYRTGDLVHLNERGELVYDCRKDYQIKIRGYRVELGEIEAAATAVEGVEYCCCLFDEGEEKLILVYSGNIGEDALNEALTKRLQDYMIPSSYEKRAQMLFNANGKIDRKALRAEFIKD